jgi:hypothetical protein
MSLSLSKLFGRGFAHELAGYADEPMEARVGYGDYELGAEPAPLSGLAALAAARPPTMPVSQWNAQIAELIALKPANQTGQQYMDNLTKAWNSKPANVPTLVQWVKQLDALAAASKPKATSSLIPSVVTAALPAPLPAPKPTSSLIPAVVKAALPAPLPAATAPKSPGQLSVSASTNEPAKVTVHAAPAAVLTAPVPKPPPVLAASPAPAAIKTAPPVLAPVAGPTLTASVPPAAQAKLVADLQALAAAKPAGMSNADFIVALQAAPKPVTASVSVPAPAPPAPAPVPVAPAVARAEASMVPASKADADGGLALLAAQKPAGISQAEYVAQLQAASAAGLVPQAAPAPVAPAVARVEASMVPVGKTTPDNGLALLAAQKPAGISQAEYVSQLQAASSAGLAPITQAAPNLFAAIKACAPDAYSQILAAGPLSGAPAKVLLKIIVDALEKSATQTSATSEHVDVTNQDAYRGAVLQQLASLRARLTTRG